MLIKLTKHTVKKIWVIIALVILGLSYFILPKHYTTPANNPITIGYIGPLTGPSAVLGMDAIKALEIGVREANNQGGINSRNIELISEDDQYLVKNTVSAYQKLTQINKAKIVLVATYGGFLALKDRAIQDDVVLIDPLDCNKEIADASKNLFCLATETESIGQVLATQMITDKHMTAGILYSTKDIFMSLVTNAFKEKFEAAGGHTFIESFNYEDTDFRSPLLKLSKNNIDGLVLLGHDETGIIMKQARNLGIQAQFYTTGTITSPGAQQASKGAAEGTIFAFWDASGTNSKSNEFTNKFKTLVGRPPILPLTTHPAYDVIKVLTERVLPRMPDELGAKEIGTELLKVSGYEGTTGTITFNSAGGAPIKESAYRLVSGTPQKI